MPEKYNFSKFKNVIIHPPIENIKQVYADSKLVLMPSQWLETFEEFR